MKKILLCLLLAVVTLLSSGGEAFASVRNEDPYSQGSNNYVYVHDTSKDTTTVVQGIDVSYHQGTINWKQVYDSGIRFAIIRVGYSFLSTGGHSLDVKFYENIRGAKAAGLKVGVYYYSQATTAEEAVSEVDYFMPHIQAAGVPLDLPVVYDAEAGTVNGKAGYLGASDAYKQHLGGNSDLWGQVAAAWCNKVAEYGYKPMIYGSASKLCMWVKSPVFQTLMQTTPVWEARYYYMASGGSYNITGLGIPYEIWQYSSTGRVPGISGNVDMDYWYVSGADQGLWCRHQMGAWVKDSVTVRSRSCARCGYKQTGYFNWKAPVTITCGDVNKTYGNKAFYIKPKNSGNGKLSYKTGNKKVVTVSSKGKVTIKGVGKTTITISAPETATCQAAAKVINVSVVPKKPKLTSLKNSAKGTMTVKWKKDSKGTGYQLQIATAKSMADAQTIELAKKTYTSRKIKGLIKKKKYYVRIRTFHKSSGLYSSWSSIKSLKLKK